MVKPSQLILFLIIVFIFYGFLYFYFLHRYIKPLNLKGTRKKYVELFLFVFIYSTFIAFLIMRLQKGPVGLISWIAWLGFGFIFTLFPFSLGRDFFLVLYQWIVKIRQTGIRFRKTKKSSGNLSENSVVENEISRRDFLLKSNLALVGFSTMLAGYGAWQARQTAQVYRVNIPIPGLPDHLAGFRIVQISDVHVGLLIDGIYLAGIVEKINELKPDMVAITGDLVDGTVSALREQTSCLRDIVSVHGSYFVTGNHEYYSGAKEWIHEIEKLGIKVLINNCDIIKSESNKKSLQKNLVIAGVPDRRAGKKFGHPYEPLAAIAGTSRDDIKILLGHQPAGIGEALKSGYHLQLSGHTHGGQFFPYNLGVPLFFKYSAGLYLHEGEENKKMWVYVNRGTGYWGPPLRTGMPSEITCISLEKG